MMNQVCERLSERKTESTDRAQNSGASILKLWRVAISLNVLTE